MKHFKSHSSLRDEEPMPVLLIVRHAVDEDLIGVGSLWDGCCWFAVAHGDVKVALIAQKSISYIPVARGACSAIDREGRGLPYFSYLQTEFDFRQCP